MLNLNLSIDEKFLIEAIRHRDNLNCVLLQKLYFQLGDEFAFALCRRNNIASIVADSLMNCGVDLPVMWRNEYAEVATRIAEYMGELDRIAELLSQRTIPLVALKNSGITRGLYPHFAASPMGDIDILVRRSDFREAHKILVESGYILKFRSPLEEAILDKAEQGGGSEYSVELPSGEHLWFELQWRPVAGRWIRPDQEPNTDELIKRSRLIPGSHARLLSPEDNLLQVSLHTAKHSYVRAPGFRLHTDVDRIVRSENLNWEKFTELVLHLKVKTAVFFSLAFAHELLDTPIPDVVLKKFAPAKWKIRLLSIWLQNVGLFDPDGPKWSRLGYIIFVSLLYDDLNGLLMSIFPKPDTIDRHYRIDSRFGLLTFYIKRLGNILFRRTLVSKKNPFRSP